MQTYQVRIPTMLKKIVVFVEFADVKGRAACGKDDILENTLDDYEKYLSMMRQNENMRKLD